MKKTSKYLTFALTLMLFLTVFAGTVSASRNLMDYVAEAVKDKDWSNDVANAPRIVIEADSADLRENATFVLNLSTNATWTYKDASDGDLFALGLSRAGRQYTYSGGSLSNQSNLGFTIDVLSDTRIQVNLMDALEYDNYVSIPLITKIKGIGEASVTVSGGSSYGISSGTYIYANQGRNSYEYEISGSGESKNNVIVGDVKINASGVKKDTKMTLQTASGFEFEGNDDITVSGSGGYSGTKLDKATYSSTKGRLDITLKGMSESSNNGTLTIGNIKVVPQAGTQDGDVKMYFTGFDIDSGSFVFGKYNKTAVETEQPKPAPEPTPQPVPLPPVTPSVPKTTTVTATAGSKQITVDGVSSELLVAPYINASDARMMVPLRFISQAFGIAEGDIKWDGNNKAVTIVYVENGMRNEVVFTIGSSQYFVNGELKEMDTEAAITDSYTFLPVYYAADALGVDVKYIPETKSAEFTKTMK